MNIIEVKRTDAINGPGVRASIWCAGCNNKCPGCWAMNTWNPKIGTPYSDIKEEITDAVSNENLDGFSILGGDPFYGIMNNVDDDLIDLLHLIQDNKKTEQTIWLWTGYDLDELKNNDKAPEALSLIDVLVSGRYMEAERDLTIKYRGSRNQIVTDLHTNKPLNV